MTSPPPKFTITDDAINARLEHGLAEGLPRIAEMLLNTAIVMENSGDWESGRAYLTPSAAA